MTPQPLSPEEVNERVARKLGWKKHRRTCEQPTPGASIFTYGNHWYKSGYICREIIPNYSGRIEAAWEVVEHLAMTTYIHRPAVGGKEWHVAFGDSGWFEDNNPAMAICLAFLKLP